MRNHILLACVLAAASPAAGQTIYSPRVSGQGVSGVAGAIPALGTPYALPGLQPLFTSLPIPASLPAVMVPKVSVRASLAAPEAEQALAQAKVRTEMAYLAEVIEGDARSSGNVRAEEGFKKAFDGAEKAGGSVQAGDVRAEAGLPERPSLGRAQSPSEGRAPVPAPSFDSWTRTEPKWRNALRALGSVVSAGIGLYGGWKIGDVAYSLFLHRAPLAGGLLAAAALAGAAYWARRSKTAGRPQRPVIPALIVSFAASALGNLLWTLTGSAAAGLGLGALLAIGLGLYASGAWARPKP